MAYSYTRTITIDKTKVPNTDRTDFTVLVSVTDATLKITGNGGHVTNANGYDIAFFSDAGLTTQLDHEIERYNATTGEIVMWVRVPTVATATDTVFYVGYGDSGISTSQEDIPGTWETTFKGVWHLPNGTTLTALDSTGVNNGTLSGSTVPSATTGQVDGGASFNGSTSYISHAAQVVPLGAKTLSAWIKTAAVTAQAIADNCGTATDNHGSTLFITAAGKPSVVSAKGTGGTYRFLVEGAASVNTNAWTLVTATWDGTTASNAVKVYVNGASNGLGTALATESTNASNTMRIGLLGNPFATSYPFNGSLDEVRCSNSARSADWIATEYNNQSSPGTFYAVGSEGAVGGGGSAASSRMMSMGMG